MDATVRFFSTLATIVEGISLDDALRIMELSNDHRQSTPDPLTTLEGRKQFARENDSVVDAIKRNRKIEAIRNLRDSLSNKGHTPSLKEVKDVVDSIVPEFPLYSWAKNPF